ncbi:DUF4130 domain-containing protein [Roseisalinus antarcticus]|uniref:DUF4130 domain-containing protein n=1 Tax=Roseisalinus antarcticus TaxID=254357 RepID=A0A1Y5SVR0_9RHOB|nr:DUF4130 domain-containing protein [Roseisalinus antarcticus]SLN49466.1 hypothetical protein ROA7023_02126 [Roseisalinus antarcticus]
MYSVTIPPIGSARAWRRAASAALAARIPPAEVRWSLAGAEAEPVESRPLPEAVRPVRVAARFLALADTVVWHRETACLADLYALLWRLRQDPALIEDDTDPALSALRERARQVSRCQRRLRTGLRFVSLPADVRRDGGPHLAARVAPAHRTLEPLAPILARRFDSMDWTILSPDLTLRFEAGVLTLHPGSPAPGRAASAPVGAPTDSLQAALEQHVSRKSAPRPARGGAGKRPQPVADLLSLIDGTAARDG